MFFEPEYISNGVVSKGKHLFIRFLRLSRRLIALILKVLEPVYVVFKQKAIKMPWKRILALILSIVVIFSLVFHFYIASRSRVLNSFRESTSQLRTTDNSMNFVDAAINKSVPFSPDVAITELDVFIGDLSSFEYNIPSSIVTRYALGDSELTDKINNIYNDSYSINQDAVLTDAKVFRSLFEDTKKLFALNIVEDERAYIEYLTATLDRLDRLETASEEFDLSTIKRIYNQIKLEAESFVEKNDIKQFENNYQNVASELIKEIQNNWQAVFIDDYSKRISTQLSSQESVVFSATE